MNAGGVISSAGFHGVSTSTTETSSTGMLKITYEKQAPSRIQAIQQEENTRRSRYVPLTLVVSFMLLFVVMCSIRFIISYTTIAHRIIL
jgi:hypothetical protein